MSHGKTEKSGSRKSTRMVDASTGTEPRMFTASSRSSGRLDGSSCVAPVPDTRAIFVHAGAGYHSQLNEPVHLKACADACKAAMALLRNGGSATDAVEMAIKVLEDNEITNAGFGSNLNVHGDPEMDAVICEGSGMSGAVAAVRDVKNPISLARAVLESSRVAMPLRRVPPIFLVGDGASEFADEVKMPRVPINDMISEGSRSRWEKWKMEIEQDAAYTARAQKNARIAGDGHKDEQQSKEEKEERADLIVDTVGAVAIDQYGNIAAGSSSGGISMKHAGRVGPAALVGVGTWARIDNNGKAVACTTSGTGEQIAHTLIASRAVDRIFFADDEIEAMHDAIEHDFMDAPVVLNAMNAAAIGILGIKKEVVNGQTKLMFIYGHTTDSMAISSMVGWQNSPVTIMSRNERPPRVAMEGKRHTCPNRRTY
ncbi:N-terminal nucleophile aminohydrolase [Ascobolus immersus RN42]|uniref:N-terminal nucleophile aminohydrolase n=1 Tax=Ascobolus immersus RN42 TaxID=1160509 RepID=A0A3N4IKW0_ASCIM|nr:N-terminal nucleophile aminohydrolase [Ascobolus immersus RN42]